MDHHSIADIYKGCHFLRWYKFARGFNKNITISHTDGFYWVSRPSVVAGVSQLFNGSFSSRYVLLVQGLFFCSFFFRLQRENRNGGNSGFLVSSPTPNTCQANISFSVFTAKPLHISFALRCCLGLVIIMGAWSFLPHLPPPGAILYPPNPDTESLLLHNFSTQHFCPQHHTTPCRPSVAYTTIQQFGHTLNLMPAFIFMTIDIAFPHWRQANYVWTHVELCRKNKPSKFEVI